MPGRQTRAVAGALIAAGLLSADAAAEPMFLSRQYTRCSTCHYSPSGGGLLTPYGRSLTHRELSTFGERTAGEAAESDSLTGEEAFLWGALGSRTGPVQLGIDLRPSHLEFSSRGIRGDRSLWMTADLLAAVRLRGWTMYGQIGRQPTASGGELDSYEYWAGRDFENGMGVRGGRFLPAYGIRFADHTFYNRQFLGLAQHDQIFGVEVSRSSTRTLLQVAAGTGRADAVLDDRREGAFTAAGRYQVDLRPGAVLVASGLFREQADLEPRTGMGGLALGLSPGARTTIWTQVDVQSREGAGELRYILVNETAFEAVRGVWLKVSPQLRTGGGPLSSDLARLVLGAVLLPRTHFNVNVSYYRDRNRTFAVTSETVLLQLHVYP